MDDSAGEGQGSEARNNKTNVGCEYRVGDLNNANEGTGRNAAEQQYAIVVSNPQADHPVEVVVEQDDGEVGGESVPVVAGRATSHPRNLHLFKLGQREVDGSQHGKLDAPTHTAYTRAAYRVTSSLPVVAFQFNPLENINVFSNDACLLKPVEAVSATGYMTTDYVRIGWPQTIACTDDPETNWSSNSAKHLRGVSCDSWNTTNHASAGNTFDACRGWKCSSCLGDACCR